MKQIGSFVVTTTLQLNTNNWSDQLQLWFSLELTNFGLIFGAAAATADDGKDDSDDIDDNNADDDNDDNDCNMSTNI